MVVHEQLVAVEAKTPTITCGLCVWCDIIGHKWWLPVAEICSAFEDDLNCQIFSPLSFLECALPTRYRLEYIRMSDPSGDMLYIYIYIYLIMPLTFPCLLTPSFFGFCFYHKKRKKKNIRTIINKFKYKILNKIK